MKLLQIPVESIYRILINRYTHKCRVLDKCKKEKVAICDYHTDKRFNKMCDI